MYKKSTKVSVSTIEGKGVFANENINEGETVWVFVVGYDLSISAREFDKLSDDEKRNIEKIGYLSPWTNNWIYPPKDDMAKYTNHSRNNNLSAVHNKEVSDEPFFIANRKINTGEELTNNYHEFDLLTQRVNPDWSNYVDPAA